MSLYVLRRGTLVKPIKPASNNASYVPEKDVKLTRDVLLKEMNYNMYSESINAGNLFAPYAFDSPINEYHGFIYTVDDVHVERL